MLTYHTPLKEDLLMDVSILWHTVSGDGAGLGRQYIRDQAGIICHGVSPQNRAMSQFISDFRPFGGFL